MAEAIVVLFSGGGTGGHLYPALALAGALGARRPDVHPVFVGASAGIEAEVLPRREVDHILLPVQGFRRDGITSNFRPIAALVRSLGALAGAFHTLRPRLVVVTGGYAGGPAGILAALTRTRLVLQEQNSFPGVTTRLLSLFAEEVHVAFPEAVGALPKPARDRVLVTGNPIAPPEQYSRSEAAAAFELDPDRPVVLVVGGSQGAHAINRAVLEAVRGVEEGRLTRPGDLQLLWSTGPALFAEVREGLAALGSPEWVRTVAYIDRMPLALSLARLAVSRAGAMATSEFLAWGVPALLVPLPTAAGDHQSRNARTLVAAGAAIHLREEELEEGALWERITHLLTDGEQLETMARSARERGRPEAAAEIAESLDRLLPPREAA